MAYSKLVVYLKPGLLLRDATTKAFPIEDRVNTAFLNPTVINPGIHFVWEVSVCTNSQTVRLMWGHVGRLILTILKVRVRSEHLYNSLADLPFTHDTEIPLLVANDANM